VQAKFLTGARNVGEREDKLRTENEELKAKLRVAEEERGVLVGELGKFRDRESLITETLLAAQATAKELRERAEADAKAMRHVAQTDIDALRRQFEQERDSIEQQLKVDADEIRHVADEERQRVEQEREALLTQARVEAYEISRRAEEMREQVEQEREAILTQARAEADERSRAAERERADLASEIERLRMLRTDVEEAVRSFLRRALETLDGAPAEGQELDHLLTDALRDRATEAPAMPAPETGGD
jgi:chromosome segregation ATPase